MSKHSTIFAVLGASLTLASAADAMPMGGSYAGHVDSQAPQELEPNKVKVRTDGASAVLEFEGETTSFALLHGTEAVVALKPEWEELWLRCPNASYYVSPIYADHSWRALAGPSGCELVCVTGRECGRLTLVWPLKVRPGVLLRVLQPLAFNSTEFTEVLAEEGFGALDRIAGALTFVLGCSGCDVLDLPFVFDGWPLAELAPSWSVPAAGQTNVHPFVAWRPGQTWEDYYAGLNKGTRQDLEKKCRRLGEQGTLRFEICADPTALPGLIRLFLEHKRAWCERIDEPSAWVHDPAYERFLIQVCAEGAKSEQGMLAFVLRLDDTVLAVQITAVRARADWLAASFNPDFRRLSPGLVLNWHCLRWAHARGLDVAMGPGEQANKMFWAGGQTSRSVSQRLAGSRRGALALRALVLRRALSSAAVGW